MILSIDATLTLMMMVRCRIIVKLIQQEDVVKLVPWADGAMTRCEAETLSYCKR